MKTKSKLLDLEFDAEPALDRLRRFGRALMTVPKATVDKALAKEKSKRVAPRKAGR